jgi:small subunit ribosomal protein S17
MSEDEKKDAVEEAPQDEGVPPAGPVAGEDSSSSQAAGEEPTPTPPTDEASNAEEAPAAEADAPAPDESAETPAAEEDPVEPAAAEETAPVDEAAEPEAAAEEPAEDVAEPEAAAEEPAAEEAEPDPEDELPWKEKRRLEKSRRPHKPGPQRTIEERQAERAKTRKVKSELRRKQRGEAKAKRNGAGTGTPKAEKDANAAKVRQGIVVSDKGQKSITVRVDIVRRHPTYEKVIRRSRTLHAHDERNEAGEGDVVRVIETRPLSKTKRWRLVEVLEKAK